MKRIKLSLKDQRDELLAAVKAMQEAFVHTGDRQVDATRIRMVPIAANALNMAREAVYHAENGRLA